MHERSIIDAIISGAENSRFGRDPAHPDAPGSLKNFFTNVCNQEPVTFLSLIKKLVQADDIEPSIVPQVKTPADVRRLQ